MKSLQLLGRITLVTVALLGTAISSTTISQTKTTTTMPQFTLPALKYKADALAPVISQATINYHHGKHLQAYVDNLNKLIADTEFQGQDLVQIVKTSQGAIFNNAAQILNHQFYFDTFSPTPKAAPTGALLAAIEKRWGTVDAFKSEFVASGVAIFGSGWVWLASDSKGELVIVKSPNAENPVTQGLTPLLGFDVWEHSYYLDFQNRRADHLKALWQIVDWAVVESRF